MMTEFEPQSSGQNEKFTADESDAEQIGKQEKFAMQAEGQATIDSYRRFFAVFARDNSLSFRLGEAFCIDFDKGEVEMATDWFAEKEATKTQIIWACLHELSHFRDLAADPEGIKGNFSHARERARQTGAVMIKKWEEAFGANDPELIEKLKVQRPIDPRKPQETMNAVETAAYQFHRTFINVFDDIYVNGLIKRSAPRFEPQSNAGQEVEALYRDKLFAKTDYTDLPRHLQFLYKLIREQMVPEETVKTSEEVEAAINRPVKFLGKDYSPQEIIAQFLRPKASRDTRASERNFVLQRTLEPIFLELLMKDLEDWQPEKPQAQEKREGDADESQEGEGEPQMNANPWQEEYEDYQKNNPDQISQEEREEWQKQEEEKKEQAEAEAREQETEDKKSAAQKAKEAQEKRDDEFCQKHQISPETMKDFRQIQAEIEPYLADLSRLWRRIIFGSSKIREREMEGHFKTGAELDVPKVIEEWPRISQGQAGQAEVMKKMVVKETLVRQPELIRVRLIGDRSGSMDEEKTHVLQQCFVLILSSLREFETYLNLTRSQTKSKLEVETEAWIFGDTAKRIKQIRGNQNFENEQAEIIKTYGRLQEELGGTYDHTALEQVRSAITPEEQERIKRGKTMEIVFEITDGGSSDPESARQAVDGLLANGAVAHSFQIGSVSESERELFNSVWNDNRPEGLGEEIGGEIGNLLPAVARALKRYLAGVRL